MKSTLLAMLLVLNVSGAFAGAGSSGGGDPLEILATPFLDTQLLNGALDHALETISKSKISDKYKSAFKAETEELLAKNNFRVLPSIILFGNQENLEGHKLPNDVNKFISLGGMTKFELGANIYLAERVQKYSLEKLSSLLMHEILHHILPHGLNDDEIFVEDLVQSLDESIVNEKVMKALEVGGYFRKDFIHRDAFMKSSRIEELWDYSIALGSPGLKNDAERIKRAKEMLNKVLPKDLSKLTILEFYRMLVETIQNASAINLNDASIISFRPRIGYIVSEFNKKIDPTQTAFKTPSFGCYKKVSFFSIYGCKYEDQVKMIEAFSL